MWLGIGFVFVFDMREAFILSASCTLFRPEVWVASLSQQIGAVFVNNQPQAFVSYLGHTLAIIGAETGNASV